MWSLPDINRLNANAAAKAQQLRREAARKRKPQCGIYGCNHRAIDSTLWFDIFSDDPKGRDSRLRQAFMGRRPRPVSSVRIASASWWITTHKSVTELELNGDLLCLRCAARRCFDLPQNWINPPAVSHVVLEPGDGPLFDLETGVLNLACCRHVLAVKQPLPAGVVFHENAEFDGQDGHQISGDNLLDVIRGLNQPFCPVVDAAYQFAVSIGIYSRAGDEQQRKEAA